MRKIAAHNYYPETRNGKRWYKKDGRWKYLSKFRASLRGLSKADKIKAIIIYRKRVKFAEEHKERTRGKNMREAFMAPLTSRREISFADAFLARVLSHQGYMGKVSLRRANREVIRIGLVALDESLYKKPVMRANGTPRTDAVMRVKHLIKLPRMQQYWADKLDESGAGPDKVASVLVNVLNAVHEDPQAALRAADMVVRLTTGYAPSKSQSVQAHIRGDAFFNADEFKDAPEPIFEGDTHEQDDEQP